MFSPRWKKEAKHLYKGARKFIQYKRDLLEEGRIGEIESRREDLLDAIKAGDKEQVDEASKQLRACCENSLPREKPVGWFEENVEVMFVAIVIALGLRAYYLQPFRIPTGSMQPTLNGITGQVLKKEEWPSMPTRLTEKLLRGRSYVHLEAKQDMYLVAFKSSKGLNTINIQDFQHMHFFSRSRLRSLDGTEMRMPAPGSPIHDAGLRQALENGTKLRGEARTRMMPPIIPKDKQHKFEVIHIPAGTVLCEGYIDTGDLVLVNKFAYHFRKPQRGETFVFDTLGITGIDEHTGPQGKGSHYIKRLCGVPGDKLSIDGPRLLINGNEAREPGIQRVRAGENGYKGYMLASPPDPEEGGYQKSYLTHPDDVLPLQADAPPGMREYAALGDNTDNSLDSRYWGSVKEYNLVGPALFSLWPFTSGHWGFIK